MSMPAAALAPVRPASPPPAESDTRLRGWRLAVARTFAFTVIGYTVLLCLISLPNLVNGLDIPPCAALLEGCILAPEQVAPLGRLGLTPHGLAVGIAVLSAAAFALAAGVAGLLLWRRSDDWMALLVAVALVLMPSGFTPVLQGLTGFWRDLGQPISSQPFLTLDVLMGLFPNGRFVPRWVWLPMALLFLLTAEPLWWLPDVLALVLLLGGLGALIGAQIYRYRRVSTPVQRLQTKWAVFGLVLTLFVNQLFWQPAAWANVFDPTSQDNSSLYSLLFYPDSFLMVAIVAVSFGVAILRYRLYGIDVIIRRTLIYGTLTVILAAVYFGCVLGAQALVQRLTGAHGDQPIIIVLSTLLIAVLFNPLRLRLQALIDRAFYRSKYDAARTLATFGTRLRTETDLGDLGAHLVAVVHETLQPAHVSLWLRAASQEQTESPLRSETV